MVPYCRHCPELLQAIFTLSHIIFLHLYSMVYILAKCLCISIVSITGNIISNAESHASFQLD